MQHLAIKERYTHRQLESSLVSRTSRLSKRGKTGDLEVTIDQYLSNSPVEGKGVASYAE